MQPDEWQGTEEKWRTYMWSKINCNSEEEARRGAGGRGRGLHQAIVNISIRERMEILWICSTDLFSGYCFDHQELSSRVRLRVCALSYLVNQFLILEKTSGIMFHSAGNSLSVEVHVF